MRMISTKTKGWLVVIYNAELLECYTDREPMGNLLTISRVITVSNNLALLASNLIKWEGLVSFQFVLNLLIKGGYNYKFFVEE